MKGDRKKEKKTTNIVKFVYNWANVKVEHVECQRDKPKVK